MFDLFSRFSLIASYLLQFVEEHFLHIYLEFLILVILVPFLPQAPTNFQS